jgi:subtilase family serine protease
MLFAAASAIGLTWNSQQIGHMTGAPPLAAPIQAQSDLVIQSLSISPKSGPAGSSVTVNLTIRNQGSGTANASTTNIRLAASSSNVTTSDPLLASISTPSISPGATNTISRAVTNVSST